MTARNQAWMAARAELTARQLGEALAAQPMTRRELSEAAGQCRRTVDAYITRMHRAGEIHIAKWLRQEHGRGVFLQVFALGPGVDAPQPRARTAAELAKRQRRKVKADPVRRVDYLQKARARETRRGKKRVKADPIISMFAGLFGRQTITTKPDDYKEMWVDAA